MKEFVAFLAKRKMLKDADAIIEEYTKLYNEKHGVVEATVTLTARLSEHTSSSSAKH